MIDTLIDKQDTFEQVRDQIIAILLTEVASQKALAILAAKDPDDWDLRVFKERANPWEQWVNISASTVKTPIVNVWYDNSSFDPARSTRHERQLSRTVYNIDCYGVGITADVDGGGHTPGDETAALECSRTIRLVRNILMAAEYTWLDLRGLVASRWLQSITQFQPTFGDEAIQNVVAARIAFEVEFNEFSPQVTPETLEFISVDVDRVIDGKLILEADYDHAP